MNGTALFQLTIVTIEFLVLHLQVRPLDTERPLPYLQVHLVQILLIDLSHLCISFTNSPEAIVWKFLESVDSPFRNYILSVLAISF